MAVDDDPFSGRWKFNSWRSQLSTPLPRLWIQTIVATQDELVVRENIVRNDGSKTDVYVWARFDGTDFPISGIPIVDIISYKREDSHTISACGKKNGVVVLTETVTVDPDGRVLTLIYSDTGATPVGRGMAVFEKEAPQLGSASHQSIE